MVRLLASFPCQVLENQYPGSYLVKKLENVLLTFIFPHGKKNNWPPNYHQMKPINLYLIHENRPLQSVLVPQSSI